MMEASSTGHQGEACDAKSDFEAWMEGKNHATLEQQVQLAQRLYDDAEGTEDTGRSAVEIVEELEDRQFVQEKLVRWKGIRVTVSRGFLSDEIRTTSY